MKHKLLYPPQNRLGEKPNIERIKEALARSRQKRQSGRMIQPVAGRAVSRAGAAFL